MEVEEVMRKLWLLALPYLVSYTTNVIQLPTMTSEYGVVDSTLSITVNGADPSVECHDVFGLMNMYADSNGGIHVTQMNHICVYKDGKK